MLNSRDESLGKVALEATVPSSEAKSSSSPVPSRRPSSAKKRKASEVSSSKDTDKDDDANDSSTAAKKTASPRRKKAKKKNQNKELAEREERALEQLSNFIVDRGGSRKLVAGFRSRVTRKGNHANKFDVNFYHPEGRRFKSMLEVGRYFKLVKDGEKPKVVRRTSSSAASHQSRAVQAEKKKLRKELDRLRKAQVRASKALDDFVTDDKESRYPIDDTILIEEEEAEAKKVDSLAVKVTPATCAAARVTDIDGFPGVPEYCIPDVLMSWDFLCTFSRALSVAPIGLDDFASALTYQPPTGQSGDDVASPPVFLAEAHLGLLKLLFQDGYSDDWWWSTLETDEADAGGLEEEHDEDATGKPVIKIDMGVLLEEPEDPLITSSWLKALEGVERTSTTEDEVKHAIKTASKVVSNKWVIAYLRKTLHGRKAGGVQFMRRAVLFLVDRVKEARPDLLDRNVKADVVSKAKAKVSEETVAMMGTLPSTAIAVTGDDVLSDVEYDDDEESDDESDDEGGEDTTAKKNGDKELDEGQRPGSVIPPRPAPTYVDMLLPPNKPEAGSEYVNPFSWPQILGATTHRILHRKKRLLNEVDDHIRASRQLPPILLPERREREALVAARVLTECSEFLDGVSPTEKAIDKLCSGNSYLQLSTVERLCLLRLLIEAAYDTNRLFEVVNGNIKQRTGAMKALEVEQRRAKREAKEKAAADEAAAREQLEIEAKDKFFDEKREEIRKINDKNKAYSDEVIESLTEEDILDFDEDFKADYESLPKADSFNKTQVKEMVARMQEEAAFDTDALRVVTMEELIDLESKDLAELEEQLDSLGGVDALNSESMDRETTKTIERLQKEISKAKEMAEKLPEVREAALEQLKDAMTDGTIKVLRSAIAAAKKAQLCGSDDATGGMWALDLMRDAALEYDNAKQNKRVLDAQRDLVAKRNKCFIRTEPMGYDRYRNRFWEFDHDEDGHVWAEVEFSVSDRVADDKKPPPGFLDLVKNKSMVECGARDMEEDLMGKDDAENPDQFRNFSRCERHSSGFTPMLAKCRWGCHATEESIRSVMKLLDSRGIRENELKKKLKESLEQKLSNDDKQDLGKEEEQAAEDDDQQADAIESIRDNEDEEMFQLAKKEALSHVEDSSFSAEGGAYEILKDVNTAIGRHARVRIEVDSNVARYETGLVTGWKQRRNDVAQDPDAMETEEEAGVTEHRPELVPLWRVVTDRAHTVWLTGQEVVDSICRYERMKNKTGYFEEDSAFLSYRNGLGRYLGRASDAPLSSSPIFFARLMVKKEAELYAKLKIGCYDNTWGGKSGSRTLWTNSMKEFAFDFETARQGLLTLENAFFELTSSFEGSDYMDENVPDVKALLEDENARHDLELETIEKGVKTLWNSPTARAVFIEIVNRCSTTGMLALALDLLCRNTTKFLQTHKLLNVKTESASWFDEPVTGRRTRRQNAWQQKQPVNYEEFF